MSPLTTEGLSRDGLMSRVIPSMVLSDGSASSMTPPPRVAIQQDPAQGAKDRFSVRGNIIVTGGAGGLGLPSCDALLEHGASGLMIFDTNPAGAQQQIEAMRLKFPHAKIAAQKVDVTDEEAVAAAVGETVEAVGSVDGIVCFAGVVGCMDALDMPIATWRRILEINTTGCMICAQAAAREMVRQGTGGSITFIASISGHRVNYPQPQAAYIVSKAALISLKNSLAAEWARYGIRTNTISPGYMDTVLNEGENLNKNRQIWASRNPSGRMGSPSELTGVVVLLASASGSYINGTDIVVDGGGIVF
ncbi:putative short chain dehydrogenase reductase family [Rosellinia necatrix]|uniref:Putative short chain dehydrogenase reductase family n=1 Tax=Rosellinia necatrix TaxID=77044 RepID=A0A1S7ULE8_ROSNE|nr:putative short chain dehydrogenase reductase family [Rosellinia necatrix]